MKIYIAFDQAEAIIVGAFKTKESSDKRLDQFTRDLLSANGALAVDEEVYHEEREYFTTIEVELED